MSTIERKTVKVGKFVGTKHVDTVIRNYKQERWAENSKRLGKEDSLSVWYSVEELEEFLAKVKDHGGDGIKVYFGAYSQDFKENPLYAGRQTVVLVATKVKETAKGEVNKDLYIDGEKGNSILAYNMGKLCPPYCGNGGTTGDGGNGLDEIGIVIVDKGEDGMVIV